LTFGCSGAKDWAPECHKNRGLDQYGTKHFEQQQFGTAGVEGVNPYFIISTTQYIDGENF